MLGHPLLENVSDAILFSRVLFVLYRVLGQVGPALSQWRQVIMEYGRIIKRAADITWRHKVLWVFGIAAALFSGTGFPKGSGGGQGFQYRFDGGDIERWRDKLPFIPRLPFGPHNWFRGPAFPWETLAPVILGIVGIIMVLALVTFIVSIIVRYTSFGALVGMVNEIEETERTSFKSGLGMGWSRLLRLFAIHLLIGVGVFIAVMVLIALLMGGALVSLVPGVFLIEAGGGLKVLGILVVVAASLGLLLMLIAAILALTAVTTLIREFAYRACVIDKRGVFDALGAGITLVRARLREAILMWLLMLVINMALSLAAIPLVLLGVGGVVGPALATYGATRSVGAAVLVAVPFGLVILAVSVFLSGLYLTFRSTVWTLTFRELPAASASS